MNQFWNERYATTSYVYGTEPNEFLKEELLKQTPGKILFPGEGEGRNAVFAAQRGWQVTAFDSSAEGKAKAERLAKSGKVSVDYHLLSYAEAIFPENSFDCIALIYTHMPADMRREYHQKLIRFLKPGGHLLAEGFSKQQIHLPSGGPRNIDMLWSKEELETDFNSLSQLSITLQNTHLEEGEYHNGTAAIIRLSGIK